MFLRDFVQERETKVTLTREVERRRTKTRRADPNHLKDFIRLFFGQQLSGGQPQQEENLTPDCWEFLKKKKKKDKAGQQNCWIFYHCSRLVFPTEFFLKAA